MWAGALIYFLSARTFCQRCGAAYIMKDVTGVGPLPDRIGVQVLNGFEQQKIPPSPFCKGGAIMEGGQTKGGTANEKDPP